MSFSSVTKNVPYRIIAQESWPVNRIFSSRPHSQELISHNEWKKKFTPFFAVQDFRLKLYTGSTRMERSAKERVIASSE